LVIGFGPILIDTLNIDIADDYEEDLLNMTFLNPLPIDLNLSIIEFDIDMYGQTSNLVHLFLQGLVLASHSIVNSGNIFAFELNNCVLPHNYFVMNYTIIFQ
jgi:hypothetical protein